MIFLLRAARGVAMMVGMTIKAGDRVTEANSGTLDPVRADVLRVSKDGKRVRVQFWGRGLRDGRLVSQWTYASEWKVTR